MSDSLLLSESLSTLLPGAIVLSSLLPGAFIFLVKEESHRLRTC
jgi:hypothetical protein